MKNDFVNLMKKKIGQRNRIQQLRWWTIFLNVVIIFVLELFARIEVEVTYDHHCPFPSLDLA